MVKRRDIDKKNPEPTEEQIEAFVAGAEGGDSKETIINLDPNAPRKFKTMSVPFNEYEYEQLMKGINLSGRSKLNFVRYAMLKLAKELQEES